MKKIFLFVFLSLYLAAGEKLYYSKYKIKTVNIYLKDEKRDFYLPLKIKFPVSTGKFPVIIFSHGLGGSGNGYSSLTDLWASSGYITIQPTHRDSLRYNYKKGDSIRIKMKDLIKEWFSSNEFLINRIEDIKKILGSYEEIENKIPEIKGKIDENITGISGHSAGAFTSQITGGVKVKKKGRVFTFSDKRIKAVLLMSPQGCASYYGLKKNSWENFTLPCMMMTGGYDRGPFGENPEWRKDGFIYSPPGDKFFVFFKEATHFTFAYDKGSFRNFEKSEKQDEILKYIKILSVSFWDAYLKNSQKAKEFLMDNSSISPVFIIQKK